MSTHIISPDIKSKLYLIWKAAIWKFQIYILNISHAVTNSRFSSYTIIADWDCCRLIYCEHPFHLLRWCCLFDQWHIKWFGGQWLIPVYFWSPPEGLFRHRTTGTVCHSAACTRSAHWRYSPLLFLHCFARWQSFQLHTSYPSAQEHKFHCHVTTFAETAIV